LLTVDEEADEAGNDHNCTYDQEDLFHGWHVLQVCPELVYAIDLAMVPKEGENLVERPEGVALLIGRMRGAGGFGKAGNRKTGRREKGEGKWWARGLGCRVGRLKMEMTSGLTPI
jgi:hypothetical protein